MSMEPDRQLSKDLVVVLQQEEPRIVARWGELLRQAQPNLHACLDAEAWNTRVIDALGVLRTELSEPEPLRYPVFGRNSGSGRVIELSQRAVEAHLSEELELHEFQGAYFLLQEALIEVIEERGLGLPAVVQVDRFIKQLSVAMAMAITSCRTEALERAVTERTEHLEKLLKKEDEFISFVSHEVRTALTAILGACDYLTDISEDPLSPGQLRYVTMIEKSGELVNVLVNDILDYAKLEAGKIQLRLEPIHLREIAGDSIALLEAKWAPKGLEMALEIPNEIDEVLGDRIRLQQVFLNLLANAIRFSPEGGRVTVRGAEERHEVWVEVEDSGPGVPEADRSRIFERFEQLDHALHRGQGTGLGLPIVKLLTEMHHGRVQICANPEGGSRFRVTIPAMVPVPQLNSHGR